MASEEDAPHERREVSLTLRCGDITQDFELGSVAEGDSVQTTVLALASSLLKETQESERAPPESPLEARLRNTEALVQATAAMVAALVSSASIGGTSAAPAGMRGGPQWHGSPADGAPRHQGHLHAGGRIEQSRAAQLRFAAFLQRRHRGPRALARVLESHLRQSTATSAMSRMYLAQAASAAPPQGADLRWLVTGPSVKRSFGFASRACAFSLRLARSSPAATRSGSLRFSAAIATRFPA